MSFRADLDWQERHIARVKTIIGPLLLVAAPLERDRLEATDLIVLRGRDMTIGVRLRRRSLGYWRTFPNQFTIRAKRDSGMATELVKILQGWGDWLFYGHADDGIIDPWMLLDLNRLRYAFHLQPNLYRPPFTHASGLKSNGDGTHFLFFDRSKLPREVTVAASK